MYNIKIKHAKDHLYKSDVRFELTPDRVSFDYSDALDGEMEKMRKIQLLDRKAWSKFTAQFKDIGVDDPNAGWRCEYWGKMMRGACFMYKCAPTPDDELYSVLEETVRDMLTAQDEHGRFSTYKVESEYRGWDIWGRKYIMLGMIYFLDICRSDSLKDEVVTALMRHADYMVATLGREEDGKKVIAKCTYNWDGLNSCSILEPFIFLYNITGEKRYLDFSEYIVSFGGTYHTNLFKVAYEDKTRITDYSETKAYEMISCFEGLAEYVKITGNEYYKTAIINFANRVMREESTIIGCLGCHFESFNHSVTAQFDEKQNETMQETCVTVTWMKFMWQLWRMTGDVKYIDELEKSAYNAMSASLKRDIDMEENGGLPLPVHSYNPLRHAVRSEEVGGRQVMAGDIVYGCCVCISSAGFALYSLASVGTDANDGIYINLYRNGRVTVDGMILDIETDYPYFGKVTVKVSGDFEGNKKVYFRIPSYSHGGSMKFRGNSAELVGGYMSVDLSFGDTIELDFGMETNFIHPSDLIETDVDHYIAVTRGPVTFALDDMDEDEPVIDFDETYGGTLSRDKSRDADFRATLTLRDKSGKEHSLVDFRSAGQLKDHKLSAWIRTK